MAEVPVEKREVCALEAELASVLATTRELVDAARHSSSHSSAASSSSSSSSSSVLNNSQPSDADGGESNTAEQQKRAQTLGAGKHGGSKQQHPSGRGLGGIGGGGGGGSETATLHSLGLPTVRELQAERANGRRRSLASSHDAVLSLLLSAHALLKHVHTQYLYANTFHFHLQLWRR
jgi:hypothetical protein